MKPNLYLLSFLVFFQFSGLCFSQQVISVAGATATGTGVQLSWTLGEPVIETFTGTGAVLTQGFHQSGLFVTVIDLVMTPGLNFKVFPNPVSDFLTLEMSGNNSEAISYMVFGLDGKLLLKENAENQSELIDMGGFPSGTYLLKVFLAGDKPLQSFKIVKN